MARSKKKGQQAHAKRRAHERHGLHLNKFAIKNIVSVIQSGKAKFVERQSLRITKWIVEFEDKQLAVVYDSKSHVIVTVLPENAHEFKFMQEKMSAVQDTQKTENA